MADLPSLEVADSAGRCLRVVFLWERDRYAHRIEVVEQGLVTNCLTTEEGSISDQWPPSPTLQQHSMVEGHEGKQVALLVGMAGKSHWSASVEGDATTTSLVFDVACRVGRRPRWLGSSYRTELPITLDDLGASRLAVRDGSVMLIIEPTDTTCIATVLGECDRVSLVAPLPDAEPPFTIRWKYRVRMLG